MPWVWPLKKNYKRLTSALRIQHRLKVKKLKKNYMHMETKKKWVSIFISDKTDLKEKTVRRDKKGHYILRKGPIHQKRISFEIFMLPI